MAYIGIDVTQVGDFECGHAHRSVAKASDCKGKSWSVVRCTKSGEAWHNCTCVDCESEVGNFLWESSRY